MVTKIGQRRFLLKRGYSEEELNKMSPSRAHNIISNAEEISRRLREQKLRKEMEGFTQASNIKRLTDDEIADFTQRAVVQLCPELSQQLMSIVLELLNHRHGVEVKNEK